MLFRSLMGAKESQVQAYPGEGGKERWAEWSSVGSMAWTAELQAVVPVAGKLGGMFRVLLALR